MKQMRQVDFGQLLSVEAFRLARCVLRRSYYFPASKGLGSSPWYRRPHKRNAIVCNVIADVDAIKHDMVDAFFGQCTVEP